MIVDPSDMPLTVGVVLVNWNGGEFTLPCLRTLCDGTVTPDHIVVVDNGSADGTPARIASEYPSITVIRNGSNEGFTGANNQGIALLLERNVDYIWILNNDTLVARDCLAVLVAAALHHPRAAGLSGKIFYDVPPDRLWYAGAVRHWMHRAPKHIATSILDSRAVGGVVAVEFISGCCMFIPAWAFRKCGGFLRSYVAYSEDSEWCWRVIKAGEGLLYVPNAYIWHKVSASVRKNTSTSSTQAISLPAWHLMVRNHLWTVRRHAAGEHRPRLLVLLANILLQSRNILKAALRGEFALGKVLVKGLLEGLLGEVPQDAPRWE